MKCEGAADWAFCSLVVLFKKNFELHEGGEIIQKSLHSKKLAERRGFEPLIELLDPITV